MRIISPIVAGSAAFALVTAVNTALAADAAPQSMTQAESATVDSTVWNLFGQPTETLQSPFDVVHIEDKELLGGDPSATVSCFDQWIMYYLCLADPERQDCVEPGCPNPFI
ncbi:MAG: hypothetical protein AAGI30_05525 [Planctomycetota bacterium]